MLLLLLGHAAATTLSERSSETVEAGVTLTQYRASSPSTDVWVLSVDLCADDVYVDATRETDDYQSTKSWGSDMDLTAATNGDFYKTDPVRVYGDAVGGGVQWPSINTGRDTDYDGEWYWEHYGWIAFQHDGVAFSHTGWVKENVSGLAHGTGNDDLTPDLPSGVLALVSGFPELVVEGAPVVCSDPQASDCFPDRSDMRERHPRTAMGITEDLSTFLLVVADGRTSDNDGLYGSELADILGQLGAWEAFNLDGGGSSQLWTDADGYVNDYDGNNYGSGARTVANHWGVFAGGRGYLPARPGHCATASPCETIAAGGGILDDAGACFRGFGDQQYWRDESAGYGGSLRWTNAFESDLPDNWAWWQVNPVEAGDYEVFTYTDSAYAAWDDVEYQVRAGGAETTLRVDPTGQDGWVSLGVYSFAAGGDQWVALFDNEADAPGSDKHIVADAVKLERVGAWCGDGACAADEQCACADCSVTEEVAGNGIDDDCDGSVDEAAGADDTGEPADSEPGDSDGGAARVDHADTGCGCSADPGGAAGAIGVLGAAGLALARRRHAVLGRRRGERASPSGVDGTAPPSANA